MTSSTTSKSTSHKPQATENQHHIYQNAVLVWIDVAIDQSGNNWKRILDKMKTVVSTIRVFTRVDECHSYIRMMETTRALVISSGLLGRDTVLKIHRLAQVDAICIICGDTSRYTEWTHGWNKIKGVHTKLRPIREAIEATV
jgi:hypothetical protein